MSTDTFSLRTLGEQLQLLFERLYDFPLVHVPSPPFFGLLRFTHRLRPPARLEAWLRLSFCVRIEVTLSAIGGLEQKGYVTKKGAPWHGYQIEAPGRKYLESKKPTLLIAPQIISIVTAVIGGVLVALIIHLLGVS